jgi:hypothetical protein
MRKRWPVFGLIALLLVAGLTYMSFMPAPEAQETVTESSATVQVIEVVPEDPTALALESPQLSVKELEDLMLRKRELREQMASQVDSSPPSPAGPPLTPGRETHVDEAETQFPGNPALLIIGRNNRNTQADNAGNSTLAEPAAANNAMRVLASGNFSHREFSTNGGVTWTDAPVPGGPADAPITCCDSDIVIDDASRVTFHSVLHINNALTNGVIRISVFRTIDAAPDCSYLIDAAGGANNILMDYPHLGLTKRFLYLTTNEIGPFGSRARVYRGSIESFANCAPVTLNIFTQAGTAFGQRVWVLAEGTNNIETAHWGQHDNSTTFRIFSWAEAAVAPTSVTRAVSTSNFGDADCRGGTGNFDFVGPLNNSIIGFQKRGTAAPGAIGGPGVLAFYWMVGPDAAHTQGHIHAAVFSLSGFTLLAQPHIFNNAFCFGFPHVSANKRGDIGISLASGGRAGGGGTAAQGFVGVDDEFTTGVGFFGTVFLTASGTHNRSDGRYGDYFTIHPYEPCEKWFTATNYALSGGTGVANVNFRYLEFGRNQSFRCYNAHRFQLPAE